MTPEDAEIYSRQQFGQKLGFGSNPALLIVDFVKAFVDPDQFGGGNIPQAVEATVPLLNLFRDRDWSVIFTRVIYAEDAADATVHCIKVPRLKSLTRSNPQSEVVSDLAPMRGELIVDKRLPSAFFETGLHGVLHGKRVDTIVVAGCTTSGCVRASTLDALCHGFRPIIPRECVGDRSVRAHNSNLFDLGQKYADVLPLSEVEAYLRNNSVSK